VIRYRGFTKRYGDRTVVDGLTFEVPRGAVVALLGPNGSGKTTSIKAAAGLIGPSSGDVVVGPMRSTRATHARGTWSRFSPSASRFPTRSPAAKSWSSIGGCARRRPTPPIGC
jgi:Cu-processing system ATP-binding protein